MLATAGIIEINKEVSKKVKLSEVQVKEVMARALEVIKQKLLQGEDISFKGYFGLKRSKQVPKISKFCDRHTRSMDDYKKTNKGKGLAAFAKSPAFKKLINDTKHCSSCKAQKDKIVKSTKLLTRVICKTSSEF